MTDPTQTVVVPPVPFAPVTEPVHALREACHRMIDDYQTSESHHPQHVLVRLDHFEALKAALSAAPSQPVAVPTREEVAGIFAPVLLALRDLAAGLPDEVCDDYSPLFDSLANESNQAADRILALFGSSAVADTQSATADSNSNILTGEGA